MSNFFSLLKVQALSQFGIGKILHGKKKTKFAGIVGLASVLLLFAALVVFVAYVYADVFAETLSFSGASDTLMTVMLCYVGIICFVLSFYSSVNALYGYKDYDLLSSLPVRTGQIVLSKIAFMYVTDLLFTVLIIAPSFFVYKNYGGSVDASLVLRYALMSVAQPLFIVGVSVTIGAAVALISTPFKRKNLVQIILFAAILGVFIGFSFTAAEDDPFGGLYKIFFVAPLIELGGAKWLYAIIYACGCCVVFCGVAALVCVFYKKMNALITAKKSAKKFKMKTYKKSGVYGTLLKKEFRRLFSCTVYAVNTLLGAVMCIAVSVFFAVLFFSLRKDAGEATWVSGLSNVFLTFAPTLFAFSFCMAPVTGCSISMEGQAFWILRTSPVKAKTILDVKLSVNTLTQGVSAFVSAVIVCIGFGTNLVNGVSITVIAAAISALGGNLGLIYNLKFPMMKWDSANKPVKQGLSVFLCVATSFVLSAALALSAYFIVVKELASVTAYLVSVAAALAITVGITYATIAIKGEKLISKIE